jgi:hypothetical protein
MGYPAIFDSVVVKNTQDPCLPVDQFHILDCYVATGQVECNSFSAALKRVAGAVEDNVVLFYDDWITDVPGQSQCFAATLYGGRERVNASVGIYEDCLRRRGITLLNDDCA